ncbi:UNVERIFIED_CONTAM: hypothetical protein PYX00_001025 [Menopon gallinae]|uniref:Uncharacterized protein n=1 Tax=Menopon gallinae TaxID=328185 RepID=A0AAW2IB79_9NEOP
MGEESINRDSISDSSCSRSSADALIAKSPPEKGKGFEFSKRNRKQSKKIVYDFLDRGTEAQKDSFKWIPNPSETAPQERRSSLLKEIDSVNLTLESARTPSYTSDFTSNTYCKNGYIRGCSGRDGKCADSPLKYNEFSSLMSTLGTGSEFPMEVKVTEKDLTKAQSEGRPRLRDDNSTYVITGSVQLMLGILMAVFGVLVIAYGSSLSGVGSGLWGGAVAMFSGLFGILAGLKGCYSTTKTETKVSPTLLTGFLALCLVSFALSNLVMVLTATGLIRDLQTPVIVEEKNSITLEGEHTINWPPVLADAGLMLAAALQCIVTVISGYKCYRQVCPCLRKNHNRLSETDSSNQKYKAAGKDRLVNHWLGQQFLAAEKSKKKEKQEGYLPWGTPNIVFLPPPPPIITSGQVPIWTFLQAPSSVFGSSTCSHLYGGSMPCCCHHDNRYHINQQPLIHESRPRRIDPDPKVPVRSRAKKSHAKERRRPFRQRKKWRRLTRDWTGK